MSDPPDSGSRVEARRAERHDERRRIGLIVLAGVLAVVAFVNIVIAVDRLDPAGRAATTTAPADTRSGAYLTDPGAATAFVAGAVSDIAAVSSFDYRRLDDALSVGLTVTTGAYRESFRAALSGTRAAALRASRTVQDFQLLSSGLGAVAADGRSAKVLLFGTQTTTSTAGTRAAVVTLTATVVRSGQQFLIGALEADANAGLPPGTADLSVAAEAGRQELTNVLSYRHDHADADHRRALDGAVDPLRSQLTANAAAVKEAVTAGGYDLIGTVTAVAVQRASGRTVVLMFAATTARSPSTGPPTRGQYEVTVVYAQGTWITSVITPVVAG